MSKLEVRILCDRLPESVNRLDQLMPLNSYTSRSMNSFNDNNNSLYEMIKKHRISIRDQKRQLLDQYFEEYESEIEQYEFLYQEELMNFELNLPANDKKSKDIVDCLVEYLNTQTMNKICQIRYNETLFRHKLLHPRHRSAS